MAFGIKLSNGHVIDFACAAGALAYKGECWWFEKIFRVLGFIRPEELTIITKTLTYLPKKGNYKWYAPWRCIRPIGCGGVVNCVGLTNPGYLWWIDNCYPYIVHKNYKVIVSIAPSNMEEARNMIYDLNGLKIKGIELNLSCPNVQHTKLVDAIVEMAKESVRSCKHPVILKLGYTEPYKEICQELDGVVEAFDLINAVPWSTLYGGRKKSPLIPYGLVGGVSGLPIRKYARQALLVVKDSGVKTPIISGGGIDSYDETVARINMGANAVTFGVLFNHRPWLPNKICNKIRSQTV